MPSHLVNDHDDLSEFDGNYFAPFADTCIVCHLTGRLVWHADEQMHDDCIEEFEAMTDNVGGLR